MPSRTFAGLLAAGAALLLVATATTPARAMPALLLPAEVQAALKRAGVPEDAMVVAVHEAASGRPLLNWHAGKPVNPASLAKLLTTAAALDRLGPAHTWSTPVWLAGPVKDGVLEGSLHVRGTGDPKLVIERVWLLLRRVMQQGVREIRGDIVLDQSAFAVPEASAADFDNEPLRPYNVRPAALLLNQRSVIYTFVPDAAAGVARVIVEPALARSTVDRSVPLAPGPCDDWRGALKASFTPEPFDGRSGAQTRTRFAGVYPAACGELSWPVADPAPASHDARLLEALWREMGGTLHGRVREGAAPADVKPSFELRSPPLAEVVRDINKFSNNVMAEQVFYSLALVGTAGGGVGGGTGSGTLGSAGGSVAVATPEAARAALRRWLHDRLGERAGDVAEAPSAAPPARPLAAPAVAGGDMPTEPELIIANGSGLSRDNRLSARLLARVLLAVYASPVMPELMASLPIAATDGTLRRMRGGAGRAHLKTGSLRDVAGIAGYVLAPGGRRLVLVAIVNHPNANAARPALEALVQWALQPRPGAAANARNPTAP